MQTEYERFVSRLSWLIQAAAGIDEKDVIFEKKGGKYSKDGDRLLIRIGEREKTWEVCALYAEDLFLQYQGGVGMEEIVRRIASDLKNIKRSGVYEQLQAMDRYEEIKGSLFIRLLNLDRNKARLDQAVYKTIGDIALVLYIKVAEEEGSITSAKISQKQLDTWGKDVNEVFEEALLNTYFMSPPRIYHWEQLLMNPDYAGDNFMDLAGSHELKKNEMGNCLSTSKKTNGAVAVFLPGVAARLAQLLDSDFYMVFTSIHEVMIHNDQVVNPEDLEQVLADTIQEATPEEDYLSSKIYHYCRETEKFVCVETQEGFQEI